MSKDRFQDTWLLPVKISQESKEGVILKVHGPEKGARSSLA